MSSQPQTQSRTHAVRALSPRRLTETPSGLSRRGRAITKRVQRGLGRGGDCACAHVRLRSPDLAGAHAGPHDSHNRTAGSTHAAARPRRISVRLGETRLWSAWPGSWAGAVRTPPHRVSRPRPVPEIDAAAHTRSPAPAAPAPFCSGPSGGYVVRGDRRRASAGRWRLVARWRATTASLAAQNGTAGCVHPGVCARRVSARSEQNVFASARAISWAATRPPARIRAPRRRPASGALATLRVHSRATPPPALQQTKTGGDSARGEDGTPAAPAPGDVWAASRTRDWSPAVADGTAGSMHRYARTRRAAPRSGENPPRVARSRETGAKHTCPAAVARRGVTTLWLCTSGASATRPPLLTRARTLCVWLCRVAADGAQQAPSQPTSRRRRTSTACARLSRTERWGLRIRVRPPPEIRVDWRRKNTGRRGRTSQARNANLRVSTLLRALKPGDSASAFAGIRGTTAVAHMDGADEIPRGGMYGSARARALNRARTRVERKAKGTYMCARSLLLHRFAAGARRTAPSGNPCEALCSARRVVRDERPICTVGY